MKKKLIIDNLNYMFKKWYEWNKKSYFYCVISVISSVIITTMYAIILKVVINNIEKSETIVNFMKAIVILSSVLIISILLNTYSNKKLTFVADIARLKYRTIALDKLMTTDYVNIESIEGRVQFEKGKDFAFMGRWSGSQDFYQIITQIFTCLLGFFSYLILLIYLNPIVVLLLLVTCVCEFFIVRKLSLMEIQNRNYIVPIYQKIDYLFRTSISPTGIKDIKLYNAENWFIAMINKLTTDCNIFLKNLTKTVLSVNFARTIIFFLRELLALIILLIEVFYYDLSISNFVFYFGIVTGFSSWIITIAQQLNNLERACYQCNEYRKFIDLKDEKANDVLKEKISDPKLIEFVDVSFDYGNINVLNNINFSINKGEKIAIVGENGAGKTTLIKILCGLYKPSKGKILINGVDVTKINQKEYFKMFSVIFQDHFFLPDSIMNNITMKTKIDEIEEKRVIDILKQIGMIDKIKQTPNFLNTKMISEINKDAIEFSGGEEQSILLARCLYKNSPIIILDEPASALDPIAEDRLYNNYNNLMYDKTIIYISHRISSTKFCDKIIFLKNGKIVENGTFNELMNKKSCYWNMYKMQSFYYINEGDC